MNDTITIMTSILSSVGITATGAWFLGKAWVEYKLKSELERKKGIIKKEIDNYLADSAAQREYEFNAKQRLYSAIGPLRFQLLISCRNAAHHIKIYGTENVTFSLKPDNYYGKSTLYRIIQPLVFAELIERQIAFADFSVDPEAIDLLCFKKMAYKAYHGNEFILKHPNAFWDEQEQHLFFHTISKIIDSLIISDPDIGKRPMYFNEFEKFLSTTNESHAITALINIVRDFTISTKAIFWVRLVFLAYLCEQLVNKLGKRIGFEVIDIEVMKLLELADDRFIKEHIEDIINQFTLLSTQKL